jgi:hypothetical protein
MLTDGAEPTRPQIERQLAKMLEHAIFIARQRAAVLLKVLVRKRLEALAMPQEAREITEKNLFGWLREEGVYYKRATTAVRRLMNVLRQTLNDYYADPTEDKLVLISIPKPEMVEPEKGRRSKRRKGKPGEAYRPRFSYHPEHRIARDYALGCHHLGIGQINHIPLATEIFDSIDFIKNRNAAPQQPAAQAPQAPAPSVQSLPDNVKAQAVETARPAAELIEKATTPRTPPPAPQAPTDRGRGRSLGMER